MLTIQNPIKLDADAVAAANLVDRFDETDLKAIGEAVWTGYTQDKNSRAKWETRTSAAMDLAMQIVKDKNFPWPGASNVAFPLVTIGSMQFHAKAYPALISGSSVVKARVLGPDPKGEATERAQRISAHMSYQVLEQDEGWEPGMDSLLINYSVVGTAFKKCRHDGGKGHNVSEFVQARDLVVDYWTQDFENCPRKTHRIPLFRNEIWEKVKRGVFKDVLKEAWYQSPPQQTTDATKAAVNNRAGTQPPPGDETTPFMSLEQHVSMDLDGDGYAEPYIITIEETTHTVLQIACRFDRFEEDIERNADGEIVRIFANEYFERYLFLPSPDGGVYGLGFGVLLGPLNESVNSLVNQLVDAGTMSNTAGGFLGRGAKIRGGVYTFAPLEWKRVDTTGEDLQKSIFPLPVREPSNVLFQLLGLLIQYADRIPGTNEATLGENVGQNTPAETARNMLVQGQKVYAAIFKRAWRAMKGEFKKLYKLNAVYLSDEPQSFGTGGVKISRADYLGDPSTVIPAADPNITSDEMQLAQAQALVERAYQIPGYNYVEAERRWLRAMKIDGVDAVYPGPGKVPQDAPPLGTPDPRIVVQQSREKIRAADLHVKKLTFSAKLLEDHRVNSAKIAKLKADAMKSLEEAEAIRPGQQLTALQTYISAMESQNDTLLRQAELLAKEAEADGTGSEQSSGE